MNGIETFELIKLNVYEIDHRKDTRMQRDLFVHSSFDMKWARLATRMYLFKLHLSLIDFSINHHPSLRKKMRLRASSKDPKDEEKLPSTRKKQGSDVPIRQLTVVVSRLQTAHSNMITPVSSADNPTPLSSLLKNKQVCKWFEIQEYEADMIRIAKERLGKMGVSDDGKRKYILDISSLDQSFVKQQEVIHELIQTERDYLSDLKMVSNLFISKMHDKAILPVSDIQTVFSNWTALIPIHEAFLSFLEQRKRNGLGFVKNISGVVCDLGLMLGSAYETYCVNHPGAMAFLEGSEKNEKLHVYLQVRDLTAYILV